MKLNISLIKPLIAGMFKKNYYTLIILVLIIFHGISNYIWLNKDTFFLHNDMAYHMTAAIDIVNYKYDFRAMTNQMLEFVSEHKYPTFYHICMAFFMMLFGISIVSAAMVNFLFIVLLLFTVYYSGRKIGNKTAGVLASFIVLMYPFIFDMSRTISPDFAMTAILSCSICLLLYSEEFNRTIYSILFGISVAFGMVTKQVYILFIMFPLLFTLASLFYSKSLFKRKVILNMLASGVSAFAVSAIWYIPKMSEKISCYLSCVTTNSVGLTGQQKVFSYDSFVYYFNVLIHRQISVVLLILFLMGAIIYFYRNNNIKIKLMLLFSILGTYLIFILLEDKQPKTTMPILVYFSLITAAGISSIKNDIYRKIIVVLVVIYCLLQYFDISYKDLFPQKYRNKAILTVIIPHDMVGALRWSLRPQKINYQFDEMVSLILKEKGTRKYLTIGLTGFTYPKIHDRMSSLVANLWGFQCNAKIRNLPFEVCSYDDLVKRRRCDFFVMVYRIEDIMPKKVCDKYQLLEIFTMQDNSLVYVYKKINMP